MKEKKLIKLKALGFGILAQNVTPDIILDETKKSQRTIAYSI
jgi:hypothetical protein